MCVWQQQLTGRGSKQSKQKGADAHVCSRLRSTAALHPTHLGGASSPPLPSAAGALRAPWLTVAHLVDRMPISSTLTCICTTCRMSRYRFCRRVRVEGKGVCVWEKRVGEWEGWGLEGGGRQTGRVEAEESSG